MNLTEQNETVIRRLYHEASAKMLLCGKDLDFSYYDREKECLDCFGQFFAGVGSSSPTVPSPKRA